jgi:hypothetical protein
MKGLKESVLGGIAGLLIFGNSLKAEHYMPARYRVRWSPQAGRLISGSAEYSPYALSYNSDGRIQENVSYSPYALSYNNSGLVADPYYGFSHWPTFINIEYSNSPANRSAGNTTSNPWASIKAEQEKEKAKIEAKKAKERREKDGSYIIQDGLREKGIKDFNTNWGFSMKQGTASTNFFFHQEPTIISYRNPEIISSLEETEKKLYESQLKKWEEYSETRKKEGWNIYEIKSGDKKEIISRLEQILSEAKIK